MPAVAAAILIAALSGCAASPRESLQSPSPPVVDLPSEAEQDALYAQLVEDETERVVSMHPGTQVPPAAVVRFVLPGEWADAMALCLTEQGFEATVHADGGIRLGPIPPEQNAAQAVAYYVCSTSYPVDARYLKPLSEAQQRYLYDYYTAVLVPCLEAEGYAIGDVPSWQTFSDDYATEPWSPYESVSPPDEEEWLVINKTCPQMPSGMYGAE